MPGGKSVPGGGEATLTLNFSTPSSNGKLAIEYALMIGSGLLATLSQILNLFQSS